MIEKRNWKFIRKSTKTSIINSSEWIGGREGERERAKRENEEKFDFSQFNRSNQNYMLVWLFVFGIQNNQIGDSNYYIKSCVHQIVAIMGGERIYHNIIIHNAFSSL